MFAQSGAQVTLSQGHVTAGDKFTVEFRNLDNPTTCNTRIVVMFNSTEGPGSSFTGSAPIKAQSTSGSIPITLPKDLPAGDYRLSLAQLNPCPDYQSAKVLKFPDQTTVSVAALPDTTPSPTRADVALSLTQKQFFVTKVAELDEIDHRLTTKIEGKAADISDLRQTLISTVESADKALSVTEDQYRSMMATKASLPSFFAEFHARYDELVVAFRAPIPGTAGVQNGLSAPNFIRVTQLQTRSKTSKKPENFSGTYPPDVIATRKTIADNKALYIYVATTERLTFDLEFHSRPKGARISYKKMLDESFTDYAEPTDVSHAAFDLAIWKFLFKKSECSDDQLVTINPYEEQKPVVVSVEFSHCRGK
jgi:hypothetical protein